MESTLKKLVAFISGLFISASPTINAGEFNDAIEKIKIGEIPVEASYELFLTHEFYVLVEPSTTNTTVTTDQFRFHIIELRNEPMVVSGESREILESHYIKKNMSVIKMKGKELINTIHPEVGVTFIWKDGGFSFPVKIVKQLRNM